MTTLHETALRKRGEERRILRHIGQVAARASRPMTPVTAVAIGPVPMQTGSTTKKHVREALDYYLGMASRGCPAHSAGSMTLPAGLRL